MARRLSIAVYAMLLLCASLAWGETICVGAAISLKDALADIATQYEHKTGEKVVFSLGSSGQIAAQIENGGEIDVFLSAANKQMDDLQKKGLVDGASRRVVVGNALVLIVPAGAKDGPDGFEALRGAGITRLAMGEPKTVPAGQYAEQVLKSLKLEEALAGKIVYGANVRQVLAYVEQGEVSAGIVYATDSQLSGDKVRVVETADAKTHEPIVYPGAIIAASHKAIAAKQFLDYLASAEAKAVFTAAGFTTEAQTTTRAAGK